MPVRAAVVIRFAGAWVPGWVATLTASPARLMKLIVVGSVPERARDDRAKSMHGWPPDDMVFSSAVMPAEDPSGRGILHVDVGTDALSWIGSPIAPLVGFSASQLKSLPVACVALKSCENWSKTFWMVSEPTPTTSVSAGVTPGGGSARAGVAIMAVSAAAEVAATSSLLTIRTFCPPRG